VSDWQAMKTPLISALHVLCGLPFTPQAYATPPVEQTSATPATPARVSVPVLPQVTDTKAPVAPGTQMHTSDLGYSYSIPVDWEIVDARPMLPVVQQKVEDQAKSKSEKSGVSCVQIDLLARHGSPFSVIETVTLPFDCLGKVYADKDLAAFATGAADGLKRSFAVADPVYSAYKLGSHSLWIERTSGTFIDHPEYKRELEITCSILKKAAVCWVAIAADADALQTFEHSLVSLEGDSVASLVPDDAFQKNHK